MRIIAVDLEATCWSAEEDPALHQAQPEESEVIEIGAVALGEDLSPRGEFQRFVRPERHPDLSPFCTRLTTITQADVAAAQTFPSVYAEFQSWMGGDEGALLVSWGRYDHSQLVRECLRHGLPAPRWTPLNAKEEFTEWARGRTGERPRLGLGRALAHLGIPFAGTAHRGIDDARNLARILQHIRDPAHLSPLARQALAVLAERDPRPANLAHLRARWSDAKRWFPQVSRELQRLDLAADVGSGRGLTLTERGRAFAAGEGLLPDLQH